MKIGVLALQGSVKEHIDMLKKCRVEPILVKLPRDMENINGLIIPGGESTTLGKLMKEYGLNKTIKRRYEEGMPIYGSCAGAILLAKEIIGRYGEKKSIKTLDALQLAACILENEEIEFVCADVKLIEIAELEGVKGINPEAKK